MEPITREEMYLAAAAGYDITPPEPITRKEFFLAKLAGMDVQLPATFSREEMFLDAVAQRSPAAVIEALNVTENGVYTAGNGVDGYSPVTVEVAGAGGSPVAVQPKDVNFYDHEGTCLYAYTVEEAQALTELPALPERDGLICQGWNWSLEDIKAHNRKVDVGAMFITDDGTTRIYITLHEGRTSPMLGVCPNGTVTVDWGDGTTPDTLTGTSTGTVKWTPTHEYAEPGDYVIKLTVDGKMHFISNSGGTSILRYNTDSDKRNYVYKNAVQRVEIGNGVTAIGAYAFNDCYSLASIVIPDSVTSIGASAFNNCYGVRYFDFTKHMVVPALSSTTAFYGIAADCEIRVPAALYDEWIAATNWATYASQIVAV